MCVKLLRGRSANAGQRLARFLLLFLSALLIGSCASAVGWGKKYELVQTNSKSVTIEYDSMLCNYKEVARAADAEASKYGKVAVARDRIDSRINSAFGGVQTIVFDLVEP